ncbi:MAG: NUDIX hydrolase [Candidatus Omnitrophica bacterium]|nr:NUDIX hydrolase [Candidatus Omnitrophota bacterium]MDD5429644.1 NUDIX hydrolase [Candidatus Omnitrophota bacterium]
MTKIKVHFKGSLIRLLTRSVKLPNGYKVNLEIVKHPGAALVVPFLNADTLLILKQYRPVVGGYLYEFPAGTLEREEKPVSCARRELREETGYSAGKLLKLGTILPLPGYSTEEITIYKATDLKKNDTNIQKDEIIKPLIVKKEEILKMFKKGKIIDAKTICALALCGQV